MKWYMTFPTPNLITGVCNSLYYNLPKSQINRLQLIQNCPARTVVEAPKSSHITPILPSSDPCTGSKLLNIN